MSTVSTRVEAAITLTLTLTFPLNFPLTFISPPLPLHSALTQLVVLDLGQNKKDDKNIIVPSTLRLPATTPDGAKAMGPGPVILPPSRTSGLSGPLPAFLGKMPKLQQLLLADNLFSGPLPDLSVMTALQVQTIAPSLTLAT